MFSNHKAVFVGKVEFAISTDGCLIGCKPNGEEKIEIPEGVTHIGQHVFSFKDRITSVIIPEGVAKIGERAFANLRYLENIQIPDSVTEIGRGAFCDCWKLQSVEIPNGVTKIHDGTFSGCVKLAKIVISGKVTEIGSRAFYHCSLADGVEILHPVKTIGDQAFSGCKMKVVNLPDTVTHIGEAAFEYCESLANVYIPDSVKEVGDKVFSGCEIFDISVPGYLDLPDNMMGDAVRNPWDLTIIKRGIYDFCNIRLKGGMPVLKAVYKLEAKFMFYVLLCLRWFQSKEYTCEDRRGEQRKMNVVLPQEIEQYVLAFIGLKQCMETEKTVMKPVESLSNLRVQEITSNSYSDKLKTQLSSLSIPFSQR